MSVPDFPFFHEIFFLRETRIFSFLLFCCGRVREERREIRGFGSSSKTQMSGCVFLGMLFGGFRIR